MASENEITELITNSSLSKTHRNPYSLLEHSNFLDYLTAK